MNVERHRAPVTITTVPRSTLAHSRHREIDAILKDLRFCSRRLKSALDSYKDELRTLERLYYKCKNQHRAALFFKRVSEIRRYGGRLSELDILECVDLLRASFVGLEHTNDHKALKELLEPCARGTMRERLEKAYCHFALAMQTGAFRPAYHPKKPFSWAFLLATASWLLFMCASLQPVDEHALYKSQSTAMDATTPQQLPSEPETSYPSHIDHSDVPSEDTGRPVSRCEPIDTSIFVVEALSKKTEATLEMRVTPPPSQLTNNSDRMVTVKDAQKARLKKAKKKFDEIDEIFGF
ncbi:hypothetical protein EV363DRAFT_1443567 [Boletus edulis]|nr:hypothetical protein EV363DRAFT_1443567 [Boletus edulis]